ncbi:MAG TPA: tetratricopeptide repeat protein [Acidobacteriaceae bacterium]|jgi:Tfp pilus assembly protein PilF/TolB-like protein
MAVFRKVLPIASNLKPRTRLDSWKEIGQYLNRDPRTAQLWEKNEGLPVHRVQHQTRSSVYAYTAEIDAWLSERAPQPALREVPAQERVEDAEASAPEENATQAGLPGSPHIAMAASLRKFRGPALVTGVVLAMISVGGAAYAWHLHEVASRPVLAVLPFFNLTEADSRLVQELTSSLVSDLERENAVHLVTGSGANARPSPSMALAGTVAEAAGQTTLTLELMDGPTQTHLWGRTWVRDTKTIESAMPEIADAVAVEIRRKAQPGGGDASVKTDLRVRKLYLTGRFYWNQRGAEGLGKAVASFQEATAIDPRYTAAYSGMAESYVLMTDLGVMSNDEAFHRAKAAAQAALSIDPSSAEAYNALAMATYRQDWDFDRAEQYFRKSIQLRPNYSVAHQWYGEFLGDLGRFDESIAELRRARELDPLSPMVCADLADGYMHAGRYAEAIAELNRVEELYPDMALPHSYLADVHFASSNLPAAEAEARDVLERTGSRRQLEWVEMRRMAVAGNSMKARRLLRELTAENATPPDSYSVARMLFASGDNEGGYSALERAYHEHSWWLVTMLVDPAFSYVRNQSRFLALAHRVGLPGKITSATGPALDAPMRNSEAELFRH